MAECTVLREEKISLRNKISGGGGRFSANKIRHYVYVRIYMCSGNRFQIKTEDQINMGKKLGSIF
jgi:hypothetical protein